ncbi:MAG: hypothetical protein MJE77_04965 [Proteobacteria bacterium]|nr:hypothetical protein [Pseudomonadota bacterium]
MVPFAVLTVAGSQRDDRRLDHDDVPGDRPDVAAEKSQRSSRGAAASSDRPGPRQWLACLVPALSLLLAATWEMWAASTAGRDVPGSSAWQRAQAAVRARYQPGDLIVVAPPWLDPVGRQYLGDLIPIDMAARMDDARYGTVWELAIRGAEAPESRGRRTDFAAEFDGLSVRRLVGRPAEVVTDFVAAFVGAEFGPLAARPSWAVKPAVVLEEVGFAPRRCVRVEPRPDRTVEIIYRGVALGTELVGHVGLADVFTRRAIRDPGRLDVYIEGEKVASVQFGVDDGWVRFAAHTRPTRRADVVFAATAVGQRARKRLVCFAAEART